MFVHPAASVFVDLFSVVSRSLMPAVRARDRPRHWIRRAVDRLMGVNVRIIWLTLCALSGSTRGRIVPSIVLTRRWGRFRKTRCEPNNSNNVSHLSGSGSISVMRRRPVGVVLPGHSTATFPERYAQLTGFVALDAAASASRKVGQNPVSGTDLPRYLALFTACPGGHAPEVPNSVVRTVPDNLANHSPWRRAGPDR